MEYAELLQHVQTAATLDRARAERVIWATEVTLAERMSHNELVRLGARLPDELQAAVRGGSLACQPLAPTSSSAGSLCAWGRAAGGLDACARGAGHARPGCGRDGGGTAAAAARLRRALWPDPAGVALKLGVPYSPTWVCHGPDVTESYYQGES